MKLYTFDCAGRNFKLLKQQAKAFDDSHHVSATAAAKVAEFSKKIGLTDKINSHMETLKTVDEKYHVSEITKSAASITGTAAIVTGSTAAAAANAFINSRFFADGALWVSDVLIHAAKVAADIGTP
ncbi:binding partner of ACD11 1 [Tripterygium wilfordii]|uniref:Binding partner of ACD11 1 n=1 Tax=Tripterygium wilfordii TaxID=458696 RepID=A0A7J7DS98_TRIWF|nr:binding partner of ACD11 1 [Tripterygium wilfordii]